MIFGDITGLVNNPTSSTLKADTSTLDYKQEFLQMLLTQLKNQDPTNPFESSEMLAQQAQFASLEQLTNLNQNIVSLMAMENVTQATILLGKTVTGTTAAGITATGTVTGLEFQEDGTPMVTVDDGSNVHQMTASNVKTISL